EGAGAGLPWDKIGALTGRIWLATLSSHDDNLPIGGGEHWGSGGEYSASDWGAWWARPRAVRHGAEPGSVRHRAGLCIDWHRAEPYTSWYRAGRARDARVGALRDGAGGDAGAAVVFEFCGGGGDGIVAAAGDGRADRDRARDGAREESAEGAAAD